MKTMTISGKRYRIDARAWDGRLRVRGPKILTEEILPAGTTLDSPDLREVVAQAIAQHIARGIAAGEALRQSMRSQS